jgi:hypothetical protein
MGASEIAAAYQTINFRRCSSLGIQARTPRDLAAYARLPILSACAHRITPRARAWGVIVYKTKVVCRGRKEHCQSDVVTSSEVLTHFRSVERPVEEGLTFAETPLSAIPDPIGAAGAAIRLKRSGTFKVLRENCSWFRRGLKVNPMKRLFMKFVSLRTKCHYQQNKIDEPARVTVKDSNNARVESRKVLTYTELCEQIHNDLRIQHPEWIEPSGESPMCDFYEARLMELLGANAKA